MRIPLLYKKGGSGSKPENHKYYQSYCICFLAFDPTRDEGCHSHSEAKMTKNVLRYKIKLFHASIHGRKQPIAHRIWLNKKVAVIVLFLKCCIKKKVFWDFKSILEISDEMPSIFFPTSPIFFFFECLDHFTIILHIHTSSSSVILESFGNRVPQTCPPAANTWP